MSTQPPSPRVIAAVTIAGTRSSHGSAASTAPTSSHTPTVVDAASAADGRPSTGRCVDVVHRADESALAGTRVAVQVGVDDRADGQRRVEGLAVGGERQHHRPASGAHAAQPHPPHLDEVLADVAAAGDEPVVGLRRRRLDVGLAHLPAARDGDAVGERARQLRNALAGLGEEVQDAHLGEHLLVPVGLGADPPGEPADAVGEGAGTGVGETAGQLVPRGEAGDARVGEPGAQAILEPAVELDEPAEEPLDAIVARRVADRRPVRVPAAGRPSSVSSGASPDVAGRRAGGLAGGRHDRRCWRSIQPATAGGSATAATWPRTHSTSSPTTCLHGWARLGHVHRPATSTWSTATS